MNFQEEFNNIVAVTSSFEPFLLSVCPTANTPEKQERAAFGWKPPYTITSEKNFINFITSRPYSSSIFRAYDDIPDDVQGEDGKMKKSTQRSTRNVIGTTDIIILDVDDGLSIEEARKKLDKVGTRYAIASTKSHTLKKNDRFRIFIFLDFKKVPTFHTKGLIFKTEQDAARPSSNSKLGKPDKKKQISEIACLKICVAQSFGFKLKADPKDTEDIDTGALLDISRKFIPSPTPEKDNFVFHARWDLPRLDIEQFLPAVRQMVKERSDKEKERAKIISAKFEGSKDIQTSMMENPSWKNIYDTAAVFAMNPFPIVYHYECSADPSTRLLNGFTEHPRIKRSGHEYATYFNPTGEYTIHDFVVARHYNLMSYLKEFFPGASTFDIMLKIQNEFKHELDGQKLIHQNPYFYLAKLSEILDKNEIKSEDELSDLVIYSKIAKKIIPKADAIIIEQLNGYASIFKISDDPKEVGTIYSRSDILLSFKKKWNQFVKRKIENDESIHAKQYSHL